MIRACWIGNWRIWGNFPFYRLEFSSKHHLLNRNKHFISPCWASYVANHIPVICPAGLLRSTNSFLMNLSLLAQRKVTKRKGTPTGLPFGVPRHSSLPTGRLDSPSGLDKAKSGVHARFALPKPNTSASLKGAPCRQMLQNTPLKLAEAGFAGRVDWPWTANRVASSPDGESRRPVRS